MLEHSVLTNSEEGESYLSKNDANSRMQLCNYLFLQRVGREEKLIGSNSMILPDLHSDVDLLVSPAQLDGLLVSIKRTLMRYWGIGDATRVIARLVYTPYSTCVENLMNKHTGITRKGAHETSYNCLHVDVDSPAYSKSFSCDILCFNIGSEPSILIHSMLVLPDNFFVLIEKTCTPNNMDLAFCEYFVRFLS